MGSNVLRILGRNSVQKLVCRIHAASGDRQPMHQIKIMENQMYEPLTSNFAVRDEANGISFRFLKKKLMPKDHLPVEFYRALKDFFRSKAQHLQL